MKKIAIIISILLVGCNQSPHYVSGQLDANGNGIVDYEHVSIVITPDVIIINRDSLIFNSTTGHSTWVPIVQVIQKSRGLSETSLDSLMSANGITRTK
jgi:hypothetical protein